MEIRQYNVYKFEELSKEAKKKAIDKWYESEDYPFLGEDIMQELEYLDTLKIFEDVKLQYSLSNCQGDGVSFSANIILSRYLDTKKYSVTKKDDICNAIYKFV